MGKLSNGISVYVPESKYLFMSEQFHKVIGLFHLYEAKITGSLKYRHLVYIHEKLKKQKTKSTVSFRAESSSDRSFGNLSFIWCLKTQVIDTSFKNLIKKFSTSVNLIKFNSLPV